MESLLRVHESMRYNFRRVFDELLCCWRHWIAVHANVYHVHFLTSGADLLLFADGDLVVLQLHGVRTLERLAVLGFQLVLGCEHSAGVRQYVCVEDFVADFEFMGGAEQENERSTFSWLSEQQCNAEGLRRLLDPIHELPVAPWTSSDRRKSLKVFRCGDMPSVDNAIIGEHRLIWICRYALQGADLEAVGREYVPAEMLRNVLLPKKQGDGNQCAHIGFAALQVP